MTDIWTFLNSYFPEESATYKSLQAVLSTLEEGNHLLSLDDLTIPAIQPLKPIFDYADPYTMGVAPSHQVVNELAELASKMEALRNIVSGTSRMTINAWRKLAKLQYNVNLMEFFTQDFTRIYLQSINNVHCDNPLERQRKCSLLMTVLADRAEMA